MARSEGKGTAQPVTGQTPLSAQQRQGATGGGTGPSDEELLLLPEEDDELPLLENELLLPDEDDEPLLPEDEEKLLLPEENDELLDGGKGHMTELSGMDPKPADRGASPFVSYNTSLIRTR